MLYCLRCHHPLRHSHHVSWTLRQLTHDRSFKAGMHETVLAAIVFPFFPVIPVYAVPKLIPSLEVFVADEIARALPTKGRACDIPPRRTRIVAFSRGKLEEQRRKRNFVAI